MLRPRLAASIEIRCAQTSRPEFLRVEWDGERVVTVTRSNGEQLARCVVRRTPGGLQVLQDQLDEAGRRLERGYSLVFAPERIWQPVKGGQALTDEELGGEVVSWTVALAQIREATSL